MEFYESATIGGSASFAGGIKRNNGNSAYEFLNSSDARLKDIGETYTGGLQKVINVPIRYFSWKGKEDCGGFGFIAQELQAEVPSAVCVGEDGYLLVGDADIKFVMWNAIQELAAQKDAEIAELRARLEALESGN